MKTKYKFDPKSLIYDKIEVSKGKRFLKLLFTQSLTGIVLAVLFFVIFSYTVESNKQKRLKRENQILTEQYKLLSERLEQSEMVLNDLKQRDQNIYKAIFETDPPSMMEELKNYEALESMDSYELLARTNKKVDSLNLVMVSQSEYFKNLLKLMEKKSENLSSIPSIQPLPNKNMEFVVYGFGQRIDPVYKRPSLHNGIDFAAPKGTEVYATADGVVTRADEKVRGYGKHIRIKHGQNYETVYAHLSEMVVKPGSKVKRGEIIGFVGNTGKSLISHLHYEIIFRGKNVNPTNYFFQELTPAQYAEMDRMTRRGGLSLD